jgi:hypothetical protein
MDGSTSKRSSATTPQVLTMIDPFEGPTVDDPLFVARRRLCAEHLPDTGVLDDATLFRSVSTDAAFRLVEVARVPSADAWQRALASATFAGPQTSSAARPGLYELVRLESASEAADGVVAITAFEVPAGHDGTLLSA